jgi:DNA invertase Pin-like site-specific DNA recombinase
MMRETGTGRLIGYVRTTTEPNLERLTNADAESQTRALADAGVLPEDIYADADASPAGAQRPGLDKAVDNLTAGDALLVTSLDRLAHSTLALLKLTRLIQEKGASLRVLNLEAGGSPINGDTLSRVLSSLEDMEGKLMHERMNASVRQRRAEAKKKGLGVQDAETGGRREQYTDDEIRQAAKAIAEGVSKVDVAANMGISRATLYRRMAALEEKRAGAG